MSRPGKARLRAAALLAALPLVVSLLTAPAVGATREREPRARLWIVIPGVPGARAVVGTAPLYLRAWARLEDPRREYVCPEWEWRWDADSEGGETSTRAVTSCDPYALDELQPLAYRSDDMRHVYRTSGIRTVAVTVRAQGREKRASRDVIVVGWTP